jgi:magnesium transporter
VKKTHAADLSLVFHSLSIPNQQRLFNLVEEIEIKGEIFSNVDEDTFLNLIEGMNLDQMVDILDLMPKDDVADLLGHLPVEKSDAILEMMKKEGSEEVEDLLHYGDDTAGGIMVPDFIALREDTTAREAIESLQEEHLDVEMPFYLYVVDSNGKLIGVSSLRQLVVVPPTTPLKNFMTTDVFAVKTDMDQEEVAKIVARYDILAVPVVDDTNLLVGIVTVDDVIDIIREEATEDILKMAGVGGDEFVETQSVLRSTRIRLPWLSASFIGGIVAFFIIGHFEGSLKKVAYLAAFIPVIMGMGGNIGTQTSTIVVRGLATGRLNIRDTWQVVFKELMVGFILGAVYGVMIGMVAQLRYSTAMVAVSVGIAVTSSMIVAALVGSIVPMGFARINVDPAVATGPFVTTAIDIVSVYFYFQIATILLGI